MGRQISFIHSESDVIDFLSIIDKFDSIIIIDGNCFAPKDSSNLVVSMMSSSKFQMLIAPSSTPFTFSGKRRGECILNGMAVEFSNCRKGSPESHIYEAGRLYVSTWYSGNEQALVLDLFEKLRKEIKKKYTYSPISRIYWGPDFLKHYNCGEYKATYTGKHIKFQ